MLQIQYRPASLCCVGQGAAVTAAATQVSGVQTVFTPLHADPQTACVRDWVVRAVEREQRKVAQPQPQTEPQPQPQTEAAAVLLLPGVLHQAPWFLFPRPCGH